MCFVIINSVLLNPFYVASVCASSSVRIDSAELAAGTYFQCAHSESKRKQTMVFVAAAFASVLQSGIK